MVDLADEHQLTAALAAAVAENPNPLPEDVSTRLGKEYRRNLGRSMRIGAQLRGSPRCAQRCWCGPGPPQRFPAHARRHVRAPVVPGNVRIPDILVPRADIGIATGVRSAGYRSRPKPDFDDPHEIPMFAAGQPVPVEIHTDLGVRQQPTCCQPRFTSVAPSSNVMGDLSRRRSRGRGPAQRPARPDPGS